jgi:heme exporter protein C
VRSWITSSLASNRTLNTLSVAAVLAMLGAAAMIFLYAPPDVLQGPVQRIFYVHVSAAIAGFACFALVVWGGVAYLWRGAVRWDRVARSAALVGLVMLTVNIFMGIVWAKPTWNWDPAQTWDAKFTTTVMLWLIYGAYLLIRKFAAQGRPQMRLAAVVGIFGFVDVPIVYESVNWWRTLHPGSVLLTPEGPAMPAAMLQTFVVTQLAVLFLTAVLVAIRYRIETVRDEQALRQLAAALELAAE